MVCARRHVHMIGPKFRAAMTVGQVAPPVCRLRFDEGDIGMKRRLENIVRAVDRPHFFLVRNRGADRCFGIEPADTRASRPNALGQRALRDGFKRDLPGAKQFFKHDRVTRSGVGTDDFVHRACLQKRGETNQADPGVVVDHRQVPNAFVDQGMNEFSRRSCVTEAAYHHDRTVLDRRHGGSSINDDFVDHALFEPSSTNCACSIANYDGRQLRTLF